MQYTAMNDGRFLAWPLDAQEFTQQLDLQYTVVVCCARDLFSWFCHYTTYTVAGLM